MHTNTNTTTTTASETGGSAFGNKIKGVVEVVHGAGENLRGTVLGAVDTITKQGPTKNDEIAQHGRLEMERGFTHLRGSKNQESSFGIGSTAATAVTTPLFTQPSTNVKVAGETQADLVTGPGAYGAGAGPTAPNRAGNPVAMCNEIDQPTVYGAGDPKISAGAIGGETSYPSHHRDDAITELPPNQLHSLQASYPGQTQNNASEYDPSRAPYRTEAVYPDSTNSKVAPNDHKNVGLGPSSALGTHNIPPASGPVN